MAFFGGDTEAMGAFSRVVGASATALFERVRHLEPIAQDAAGVLTGLSMSTPPGPVGLAGISAELGGQGDDVQRVVEWDVDDPDDVTISAP